MLIFGSLATWMLFRIFRSSLPQVITRSTKDILGCNCCISTYSAFWCISWTTKIEQIWTSYQIYTSIQETTQKRTVSQLYIHIYVIPEHFCCTDMLHVLYLLVGCTVGHVKKTHANIYCLPSWKRWASEIWKKHKITHLIRHAPTWTRKSKSLQHRPTFWN